LIDIVVMLVARACGWLEPRDRRVEVGASTGVDGHRYGVVLDDAGAAAAEDVAAEARSEPTVTTT
jgi:hypothetical protein